MGLPVLLDSIPRKILIIGPFIADTIQYIVIKHIICFGG